MPVLGAFYRRQLLEDVLPFWFPRACDEKNGGLYHCFDADGALSRHGQVRLGPGAA